MDKQGSDRHLYEVLVEVRHKEKIADPEGNTIKKALSALGYDRVSRVSVGKAIRVQISADNETEALNQVDKMTQRLLANPVLENYSISVEESNSHA